ncbi:hypothetical protein Mal4_55560 [Maioricimonas rarisocia]|uniref:Uncharacterized protein n=1 Tax=Maioricimonas rarisocia TaxID=2528026 RepID=A0A517ZFF0_9PLAN|nr:hypothetical protein Mal4_55560 [Maioricimonas rarisocia]
MCVLRQNIHSGGKSTVPPQRRERGAGHSKRITEPPAAAPHRSEDRCHPDDDGPRVAMRSLQASSLPNHARHFAALRSRRATRRAPASCLLLPVSCFLSPASCLLLPVSCFLSPASCLLLPVSCFLSPASCLLLPVSCFLSPTSCLLLPVSPPPASAAPVSPPASRSPPGPAPVTSDGSPAATSCRPTASARRRGVPRRPGPAQTR